MEDGVHHEGLTDDKNRKPIGIDRMDLPRDHEVARYGQENQQVHPGVQR